MFRQLTLSALILLTTVAPAGEPAAPPQPVPAQQPPPLYSRIGGLGKLAGVAEALAPTLSADEAIKANEALRTALAAIGMPELKFHLTAVLAQLTGGPERYTGTAIPELIRKYKITDKEKKAALAALKKAVDDAKIPEAEAKDLLTAADNVWSQIADIEARTIRDKERGFTIMLPAGWKRQEVPGVALSAAPPKDEKAATSRENLNVVAEELPVEMSSAEFAKAIMLVASRQLKEFKASDLAPVRINGEPGEFVYYTHKNSGAPVGVAAYFIVRGKRAYTINCVAPEEAFQALKQAFNESVTSFRIE